MAVSDRYATFANFGGGHRDESTRPLIKGVVLAESIKRRLPSKHYVYKMVVEWTSGTSSIVYRRYSMFFDFQVKLQELYQGVCHKQPQFVEKVPHLPELPGKILFGRSHIHQVAEKRRGKIEEFCQQVVSLPPEISHTNLVMGFFNTWPDDTMLPQHSESVSSTSSTFSPSRVFSPTSPASHTTLTASNSTPFSPPAVVSASATEAVISHPDEMENLEQFSVLADYHRKDSHQVNLSEGQVVHVIEKHDTGWWMVMSDDEQGYAPAAYLEPMEGGRKQHNVEQQQMESENTVYEEYEAMESYSAQSGDEVTFKTGDTVQVLSKSLDGWWKIRCNNKVGMAPSALIRKPMEVPQVQRNDVIYESHKSIYEGLNIHKPPPRRNTIERNYNHLAPKQEVYAVPRPNPPLVKMATDPTISHTVTEDTDHDYVEPPLELTSEDEEDPGYYRVPRALQSSMSDTTCNRWNGSLYSPPPSQPGEEPTPGQQRDSGSSGGELPIFPERDDVGGGIYEPVLEESPYEMEPVTTPLPSPPSVSAMPVYQNANDARAEVEAFKSSRSNSTELLNVTGSSPVSPLTTSPPPQTHTAPSRQDDGDYVDIDQHDEYVDPGELMGGSESSAGDSVPPTSPSAAYDLFKPLPKPPLPTSDPPKKKPMMAKSKSLSMELLESAEDEYVPMDPIYTEPPLEGERDQPDTPNPALSQQQHQKQQEQSKTPTPSTPSSTSSSSSFFASSPSPAPQTGKQRKGHYPKLKVARDKVQISSPVLVEMNNVGLSKAKSLEDILASASRESSPQRHGSPHSERKASPGRFPILPPLPATPGSGRGKGKASVDSDSSKSGGKRKLAKVKSAGKLGARRTSETPQVPHHVLTQSSSPPRDPSPEHRGVTHTNSVPTPPPAPTGSRSSKEAGRHLKTHVALSSYHTSVSGCLSFQAGDKCVLLRKTPDGWWLVNIGGREGWTPEVYWKEEAWTQTTTIARPAGPAPTVPPLLPPDRKPRSHTVAADGVIGGGGPPFISRQLELTSSMEGSLEASSQSSWGSSVEVEQRFGAGDALESSRKPTPPPPPPQNLKPGRREPLLPKPKPGMGNPQRKKGDRKPPVPHKPTNISSAVPCPKTTAHTTSPPSSSPPLPRRRSEDTPSPPPPPAPFSSSSSSQNQRRFNAIQKANSVDAVASSNSHSEYIMLENARTLDPLESSPWFVGKMERVSAEQFLMEHGRQREFLVRERTAKDGYYALSIRYHYSCKHFNIDPTAQGQYSIGNLTFPAISDIIHHYQNNSLFIHENQHVTLATPARRRTRGSDIRTHS